MKLILDFYGTTVGKKVVMAVSGLILVGFVIGHMIGNLKTFAGMDPMLKDYELDIYAEHLRVLGSEFLGRSVLLWGARLGLLAAVILHAISGIQLARLNRKAKPIMAHGAQFRSANPASRTMFYGGLFLVLFIVLHLLHFTTGTVHPGPFVPGQAYSNVWLGFQSLLVVGLYVLAMAALAMHLYHGVWSMFHTLGLTSPAWNSGLRTASKVLAVALFLGFSVVPVAVAAKILAPPVETPNAQH